MKFREEYLFQSVEGNRNNIGQTYITNPTKGSEPLTEYQIDVLNMYDAPIEYKLEFFIEYLKDRWYTPVKEYNTVVALSSGMDPKYAELYDEFSAGMILEVGASIFSNGVKAASNLKRGFTSNGDIIAGSGLGSASNGGLTSGKNKAKNIANQIKNNNGLAPKGYKGGRKYRNIPLDKGAQKLPQGTNYREYDVNPYVPGKNRGKERIVIGDDGSVWYTNDHYFRFIQI